MTDPQQPFSAPQPPVANLRPGAAPGGTPRQPPTPGYVPPFGDVRPAPTQPLTPTYPGYGYPANGEPGAAAPQNRAKGAGIATTAVVLASVAFALEVLRYIGISVAYAVSSDATLPQPVSMAIDVVLFLLYAGAVVLALIGLPRRPGRLRSGIALGLGISGAVYLVLQFVFTFIP